MRDAEGVTARWEAPGRVNLIGEHLDYNGGPVLPFALDLWTTATVSRRSESRTGMRITSNEFGAEALSLPLTPERALGWVRYAAGAAWAFADAVDAQRMLDGLAIDIGSTIPSGAGLSSSAAVECAVICALDELAGTALRRREIAQLALKAEREFVGVPCGPMDQLAVMLSQPNCALLINSRNLETVTVPMPFAALDLTLLLIDTRVKHALGDSGYADRRAACEAAAAALGLEALADADPEAVQRLRDPILRRRARHVVSEVERVDQVVSALNAGRPERVGPPLTASHRSLAEDFEVSCPELDAAVEAALAGGALGARMTGAGFGGCVIALCNASDADAVAAAVQESFKAEGWAAPRIWPASPGPGARRCPTPR